MTKRTNRPATIELVGFFCVLLMWSYPGRAQFTSAVEGFVTDPTGAAIPQAIADLHDSATGTSRQVPTTDAGYFRFTALAASDYTLRVSSPGFRTAIQENLRVQVSEIRTIHFSLMLSSEVSEVNVMGEAPLVETGEARVSELISEQKLRELPLVGRNFFSLVLLTPGVTGLPSSGGDIFNTNYGVDLYAAGHRAESNNFLVDSVSVTSTPRGGIVNLSPNADSVQEVRVAVNDFSAEHGRNAAAVVNVVTKQGTNQWHGTASWFHTQNAFAARNVFQPRVPRFQKNEVAGSLGGPIQKDRTFVFSSIQGLRSGTGAGLAAVVATPQFIDVMQQSRPDNISTFLWKSFSSPVTPVRNFVSAGALTRVDCSSLPTPVSPITSPVGNIPCNLPITGEGDFAATVPRDGIQWNARLDHEWNEARDRLYVNVYRTSLRQGSAFVYPAFDAVAPSHSFYVNVNETHILSPFMINQAALSYVRSWGRQEVKHGEIPLIFPAGLTGFGTGTGPSVTARNNFEFRESVAFTSGKHHVTVGGIVQRGQSNGDFTGLSHRPGFIFASPLDFANDSPTRQVNVSFDPVTGQPKGLVQAIRTMTVGAFIQDDWKLRPNLTINLGLRWETFGNPADANGRMTNLVFPSGTDLASKITSAKVDIVPKLYRSADLNNWAPRIGFAWAPAGRANVSIRGGFGIFYDRPSDQLYLNASSNTPVIARAEASIFTPPNVPRFALGTSDKPPYYFPMPPGVRPGLDEKNGLASGGSVQLLTSDPDFRTQYAENWFFGVQYSPVPNWILEVNYIGSAGHKLYGQTDVNRFNGDLIQNNGVLTRLNGSFGVIEYGESNLNSIHHGGTASIRKRLSNDWTIDAAYTLSKTIDQFSTFHPMGGAQLPVADVTNLRRQRGPADFDAPHKLASSVIWELPEADFRLPLLNRLFNGWGVAGVTILQSGPPFSVICSRPFVPVRNTSGVIIGNNGCDYNADGFNYDFPNTPAFGNSKTGLSRSDYRTGIFSRAEFPAPSLGQQGDLGRNTFRGPGYAGTDLSVMRSVHVSGFPSVDGATLQFRAEIFNLFNRVNLRRVNGDLASSLFGKSSSAFPARNLQFALRLEF